MEKYEQISVVGEGSYGLVMKCRHKESDQIVAIKKFLETEEDATVRRMALREIRMLKRLKHENLVAMIEVFRHRKRFYLVFEYLDGTVLDELERMPNGLGEDRSRDRIFQITRAINYCHSNHIIHRDVKPENVLVSSQGVVKLCDFGFARLVSVSGEPCTEYVATRWYRAPELLVGDVNYSAPVDIWAIGCLFAEMLAGDPLFPGDSDIDQLYLIVKMLGKPCIRHQHLMAKSSQLRAVKAPPNSAGFSELAKTYPDWPELALDFLASCMKMDPNERCTSDELLKSAYFQHDRFPAKFLPNLRERVNCEFNSNPLLRKFKTEILMSTDKKEESSRNLRNKNEAIRWKFTLTEPGGIKRKFNYDIFSNNNNNENRDNLISLSKTSQRLQVVQKGGKLSNNGRKQGSEIEVLEKSMEGLVRNRQTENRPVSVKQSEQTLESDFQSLQCDLQSLQSSKSPSVLHPSINNISFNNAVPKKSPNLLQTIGGSNNKSQAPLLGSHRNQFLKKIDNGDWLSNFGGGIHSKTSSNLISGSINVNSKKEGRRSDVFTLPNLPGVTSPNKSVRSKKGLDEVLPTNNTVTPRIQSSTSQNLSPSNQKNIF